MSGEESEPWWALLQRATAAHKTGQLAEAEALYRQLLVSEPHQPDALFMLSVLLAANGRGSEAVGLLQTATAVAPDRANIHYFLGVVLQAAGDRYGAVKAYARAVELDPKLCEAHMNMGVALREVGLLDDAIRCEERALALQPDSTHILCNLGSIYKDLGRFDAAIAHLQRALDLDPTLAEVHSNLLYILNYSAAVTREEVYDAHRGWEYVHGQFPAPPPHPVDRTADRRLRIGYVSPDLCFHSVANFIEPVLRHHDRLRIDLFCYSDVIQPDEVTFRLAALIGEGWRVLSGLDDEQAAQKIRDDRVDILIDLAGHTSHNRLRTFARRPAPVQVSWMGYPNTTGLSAIDYRLTDRWADPEGAEAWHSEKLVRLPHGFLCYQPPTDAPLPGPPPCETKGFVTFGSFNQLAKLSPETIVCWAEILRALPTARLLIKARGLDDPATKSYLLAQFEAAGVAPDHLELAGHVGSRSDHLATYGRVDIALDPFPYNGTTTTCEALWMGVPTVVLAGDRHVARVGVSLLSALALEALIADSMPTYIECAKALALDATQLAAIRSSLRPRFAASPMTDAPRFVQALEEEFFLLWRRWLAGG